MKYKAGKLSFLLVCLFLCTGCRVKEAVFVAGEEVQSQVYQEETAPEEPAQKKTSVEESAVPERININTADSTELMMLPGIGEVRAKAIIEYRQRAGEFETIEDIMNVKGIKTGIFSKINSLICVK